MKLINLVKNITFATLTVLFSVNVSAQIQVIHAGILLAIPGNKPLTKQTIVVEKGKIIAVKNGYITADKFGQEAKLIDLSSSFVMPGLMDMHVHLQSELGSKNDSEKLRL